MLYALVDSGDMLWLDYEVCNVPTGRLSDLDARGCLSESTTTKYILS
jgi:hypothetical protein